MEAWEKALEKFLKSWQKRRDVQGALLTGSYAFGTSTPFSDVDVHIVLADTVKWRERGNRMFDGVLIEYFANTPGQLKKYQENDTKAGRRLNSRMFALGRVLFDKTGTVTRLQKEARDGMRRPLRRQNRADVELGKYSLWDGIDSLKDAAEHRSMAYRYLYYVHLSRILETYTRFLRAEVSAPAKLARFFGEPDFRNRLQLEDFPDRRFSSSFLHCLDNGETLIAIESLTNYVIVRMGGFNINGWRLRSLAQG